MAERFWLMWGWKDLDTKPAPRLVVKGQEVYSEANFNLQLDIEPDTGTIASELDLGRLLDALTIGYESDIFGTGPLLERCFWEDACIACRKETQVPCQIFMQAQPRGWPKELSFPDAVRSLTQGEPDVGDVAKWCAVLRALADMTETPAERRFYELYLAWAVSQAHAQVQSFLEKAVTDPQGAGLAADVGTSEWVERVLYNLLVQLEVPALIPQVVLNFVRTRDLPEYHPDHDFFSTNAGRVDFAFVHKGQRHIVEIDGPVHHATEERYTRNLRVDRTLRHQGWQVHRFSNLEVRQAKNFREFVWELGFS